MYPSSLTSSFIFMYNLGYFVADDENGLLTCLALPGKWANFNFLGDR
jgi:hypothetical protein